MTNPSGLCRSSSAHAARRLLAITALALAGCSALPVITPDMARVDPAGRPVPGRERPHRLAGAQPRAGGAGHRRRSEPGRARPPPRPRAGGFRQPARPRQSRRHPRERAEHLRGDARRDRLGARQHQHGDLHPRRRRGRQPVRRCPHRQAGGGRAGEPHLRRRRRAAARRRRSSIACAAPASTCSSSTRSTRSRPRPAGT